jgi:antitoxin MazE
VSLLLAQVKPWGNSQGVRISKKLLKRVGLRLDDSVEIFAENDALVIKPVKEKLTIEKLFENWDGLPPDKLTDWERMKPAGRELL